MTKPKAKAPAIFDMSNLAQYQVEARYHWREIEREDREPLNIKVLDLSTSQTNSIPYGMKIPLVDAYEAIAPYVVEWDLKAVNTATGETVDVPPPAEVGPGVLGLLDSTTGALVVTWLKAPHVLRSSEEKKGLSPSDSTPAP